MTTSMTQNNSGRSTSGFRPVKSLRAFAEVF